MVDAVAGLARHDHLRVGPVLVHQTGAIDAVDQAGQLDAGKYQNDAMTSLHDRECRLGALAGNDVERAFLEQRRGQLAKLGVHFDDQGDGLGGLAHAALPVVAASPHLRLHQGEFSPNRPLARRNRGAVVMTPFETPYELRPAYVSPLTVPRRSGATNRAT